MIVRITGLILCLTALLMLVHLPAAEMRPPSILVLDQSEARGPFYYQIFSGLRSSVNADTRSRTTIYAENFDLKVAGAVVPDLDSVVFVGAIVQAHKGRIWAENVTGGGAVFRLSLPLCLT
jgi:hypothetical protein